MFVGVGYVLSLSMQASNQSYDTVRNTAASNRSMRETTTVMRDELKAARRSSIQSVDVDGFTQIQFRYAIEGTGAVPAWGVFDRSLSPNEADCNQPDWTVRYSADAIVNGSRPLVRSIFDTANALQFSEVLVDNVTQFRVTESGDLWVVRVTADSGEGRHDEEFDVRTRDV